MLSPLRIFPFGNSLLVASLLVLAHAGPSRAADLRAASASSAAAKSMLLQPQKGASALQTEAETVSTAVSNESATASASSQALKVAALEHAPLAFFSLGSLAVGGVFYGINRSLHNTNVAYTAGDRSQITAAVGLAGLTALLAAGSYCYYVRQSAGNAEAPSDWDASVTSGVSPEGDVRMGALLTFSLPSLSR